METPYLDKALKDAILNISLDDRMDEVLDSYLDQLGMQIPGVTLNGGPIFENDFEDEK